MLAISSERLSISSRIACVTALISPLGSDTEDDRPEPPPADCRPTVLGATEAGAWARTEAGSVVIAMTMSTSQIRVMIAVNSRDD